MQSEAATLEKAAKYICNTHDGLCPMMVEQFSCPTECDLDTLPWRCWISFFNKQQTNIDREEQ